MKYQKLKRCLMLPLISAGIVAGVAGYITRDPYKVVPGTVVGTGIATYFEIKRKKKVLDQY